ncbi:MAG TPA: type II toxin-antitoxin system Phd/YefM family antitoxin [Rhodoblastus sp.]|nr:type II toxin-antitoxin system Phd/YefM family antitoxin [Rhodoblastus sp.]
MKTVQASEAKAKFLSLLDDVERGETIVVTRHGKPIARIQPEQDDYSSRMKAALDAAERLRTSLKAGITIDDIVADIREDRDR